MDKIAVAGYCRVSTDLDDQVNSFESQQWYFRTYISQNPHWELYTIYADEGISGTSTKNRREFHRMIQDAREGKFRLILTKEVSRFSRNILDTILYTRELKKYGVAVLFTTDSLNTMDPESELRLSIMASMAQEESRRTSCRVVWGQTRQMEKGVVFGPSLIGYSVIGGRMRIEPQGAETVRLIFRKYALEKHSAQQIAALLNDAGHMTAKGRPWSAGTVLKILHNEKYAGDLIQKKTYTPDYLTHERKRNDGAIPLIIIRNHHEPIIDRDLWELTQARLNMKSRNKDKNTGLSEVHLFSGKIQCGNCGEYFVSRCRYRQDGSGYRRWSCASVVQNGATACKIGRLVRDDDAVQMLQEVLNTLSFVLREVKERVADLVIDICLSETEHKMQERLHDKLVWVQKKRDVMMECYFSGEITAADMKHMNEIYQRQQETIIQQQETEAVWDPVTRRTTLYQEIDEIFSNISLNKTFGRAILHSLTVFPDRHLELRLQALPCTFHFL